MGRPVTSRRRFLCLGGRGAVAAAALPLLTRLAACGEAAEEAPPLLEVPLAELPDGTRRRYLLDGVPVELHRAGEEIVARSLLCTHQGCEVSWQADRGRYFCPCHDGTFDAEGRVTGGPPTRPLRTYPVRRLDDVIMVGP